MDEIGMIGKVLARVGIALALLGAGWGVFAITQGGQGEAVKATLVAPTADVTGFDRADGPRALSFPADFGPHPNFQTEWWYYTGNLDGADGRHFGYQLTIFRRAIQPLQLAPARTSDWATDQVYLAHFALTDVTAGKFQSYERLERGAAGLAGAHSAPQFRAWLDDWSIEQTGAKTYALKAAQDGIALDLTLDDLTGPVLEGDQGYSRKGLQPGNASYYFSQPRLQTQGTVTAGGQSYSVSGLSWMDHEFSTSGLRAGLTGWDWFALQLSDGSELMVYSLRRADGTQDPFSSGMWIAPDGATHPLQRADFKIDSLATWHSAYSNATYPARWQVAVPSLGIQLTVSPYLADQEHHLSTVYWEGAVQISGARQGQPVSGAGYVELTGYAGSLGGRF
jgi:predicted secreted hydrolase